MSSTIWGMPSMRSMSQVTAASAFFPPSAATAPMTSAMMDDTPAARRPTSTLVDSPASVRSSMSRPIQSVPKGWAKLGARFFIEKSVAVAASATTSPATTTAASAAKAPKNAASVNPLFPTRAARGACRRGGAASLEPLGSAVPTKRVSPSGTCCASLRGAAPIEPKRPVGVSCEPGLPSDWELPNPTADSQVKQVSTRSSAMSSPLAHAGIHHAVQRAGYQVAGEHEGGGE